MNHSSMFDTCCIVLLYRISWSFGRLTIKSGTLWPSLASYPRILSTFQKFSMAPRAGEAPRAGRVSRFLLEAAMFRLPYVRFLEDLVRFLWF